MKPCKIHDCGKPAHDLGWCATHASRFRRRGDPLAQGQIRGDDTRRIWSFIDRGAQCWEWRGLRNAGGYGLARFKKKKALAHRAVWEMVYGAIPPGMCVCHRCDNPACCRPDHLFLGSNFDNTRDKMRKGRARALIGEAHGRAKVTWPIVAAMRARYPHESIATLAREFGLAHTTASHIVHERTWSAHAMPTHAPARF